MAPDVPPDPKSAGRHSAPASPSGMFGGAVSADNLVRSGKKRNAALQKRLVRSRSALPAPAPSPFAQPEAQNMILEPEPVKAGQLAYSFGGRPKPTKPAAPASAAAPAAPPIQAPPASAAPPRPEQPAADDALQQAGKFKPALPQLRCGPTGQDRRSNPGSTTTASPPSTSSIASSSPSPTNVGAADKEAVAVVSKMAGSQLKPATRHEVAELKHSGGFRSLLMSCFGGGSARRLALQPVQGQGRQAAVA